MEVLETFVMTPDSVNPRVSRFLHLSGGNRATDSDEGEQRQAQDASHGFLQRTHYDVLVPLIKARRSPAHCDSSRNRGSVLTFMASGV